MIPNESAQYTPQWRRWEQAFTSTSVYENPVQAATLVITFNGPAGTVATVDGFWDGGTTWRVRFMPTAEGTWTFTTACSDAPNMGLHGQKGMFTCVAAQSQTRFDRHGAVRLSDNRRYLAHADGTPFLWLADTVWNGPLLATDDEWACYVQTRAEQQFNAAQWVATQWLASPHGDLHGRLAYSGSERLAVNPAFFQRLDARLDALNDAGLLAAPVLLWAARWLRPFGDNAINPGLSLPEDQAILLARYMVARWGAHHVLWMLNGDGHYNGEAAERWRSIGRGVFGGRAHAPVALHPGGLTWIRDEFNSEAWFDVLGYQSAHKLDEESLRWLVAGPPARDWHAEPHRPLINLEPPYEDHMDMASDGQRRIGAHDVRRALYTSLLIAPTAGVTYGGHGIWGWDDGTQPPTAHPRTGVPQPWREALHLPGADQLKFLARLFADIPWWQLRPAPTMVLAQPGHETPSRMLVAARSEANDFALVYTPVERRIELCLDGWRAETQAQWFNPVNGAWSPATRGGTWSHALFETPAEGDWILLLKA